MVTSTDSVGPMSGMGSGLCCVYFIGILLAAWGRRREVRSTVSGASRRGRSTPLASRSRLQQVRPRLGQGLAALVEVGPQVDRAARLWPEPKRESPAAGDGVLHHVLIDDLGGVLAARDRDVAARSEE